MLSKWNISMHKLLIMLGASLIIFGCASTNSQTASTASEPTKQVADKDDDKPKVICQKTHRVGTNFKKLQCWTKEEYALKQQRDREEVERMKRSGMAPPSR